MSNHDDTSTLKAIHTNLPFVMRWVFAPAIELYRFIHYLFPDLYFVEGIEQFSQKQMWVAYIGIDGRTFNYWMNNLFSEYKIIRTRKYFPIQKVKKSLSTNTEEFELFNIELNQFTGRILNEESGFLIPRWIDFILEIDLSLKKKQIGGIKKDIQTHELTFELKYSIDDLKYFYRQMYHPYIRNRHGKESVISSFNYYRNFFNKKGSVLAFIKYKGKYIVGSLNIIRGIQLRMLNFGVMDGNYEFVKLGGIGADNYFLMLECKKEILTLLIWVEQVHC